MSDLIPWMSPWSGRLLALLLFAAGLILAWRSLFPRLDGRPRCPKCNYDLTGGISSACPECGHSPIQRDRPGRLRRRYKTTLLGLAIAFAMPVFVVQRRVRVYGWEYYLAYGPGYWVFGHVLNDEVRIGDVTFRIYTDRRSVDYNGLCKIKHGWFTLAEMNDFRMQLGIERSDGTLMGRGEDITRDGRPNVIITSYSGGAHCCAEHVVFDVYPDSVKAIAKIQAKHGYANFTDLNGDGAPEVELYDWTFAYWNTSFASSPAPRVVLSFDHGTYQAAPDLMAAPPPPTQDEWDQRAHDVHASLTEQKFLSDSSALWGTMLDLIYTGHPDLAWQFLDKAWPNDRVGKQAFIDDFRTQIDKSPYRDAIHVDP